MLLANDVQTIVFARSRVATEVLLLTRVRQATGSRAAVRGYRGGYRPLQRREIEQRLRRARCAAWWPPTPWSWASTSASWTPPSCCGYPGTVASTWQQAGRAGRRQNTALAVLVADSPPRPVHRLPPGLLLRRSPEHALVNPDNLYVLMGHLPAPRSSCPSSRARATAPATRTTTRP